MTTMFSDCKKAALLAAVALFAALVCSFACKPVAYAYIDGTSMEPSQFAGSHTFYLSKSGSNQIVVASAKPYKKAKSSNKSVAAPKLMSGDGWCCMTVKFKKPGKATITFKYGTKTYKGTWTVKKYENPFKTLKIGGKDYKAQANVSNFEGYMDYEDNPLSQNSSARMKQSMSGKRISIKMKTGWKLVSIEPEWGTGRVKNGGVLPKGSDSQNLVITVKRTGKDKDAVIKYALDYWQVGALVAA